MEILNLLQQDVRSKWIYPEVNYNMVNLESFIEVYGNVLQRNRYLLALRFKRPIIKYHSTFLTPIEVPDKSIIVIQGKSPTINGEHSLIFSLEPVGSNTLVPNISVHALLLTLLPHNSIIKSFSHLNVLYVITTRNPFQSFWKKCRKNVAFRALDIFINATVFEERILEWEEMALLRLFKRNSVQLKNFNSWYEVAFQLSLKSYEKRFKENFNYYYVSPDLAQNIYQLMKKSINYSPSKLPDPSFYECEIFFTDTDPVGILYKVQAGELIYVSPMIVTQPPNFPLKDVNKIDCNGWLPFYKNHDNWTNFSMYFYLNEFYKKRHDLRLILAWLYIQTIEKYKTILLDMMNVGEILLGDESRWFLKR